MKDKKIVCIADFREYAEKVLPRSTFLYIDCGAEGGEAIKENLRALRKILIIPRVLKGKMEMDTSSTVFGRRCALPFGFAPWAMNTLVHSEGECLAARVAALRLIPHIISIYSTCTLEKIAHNNSVSPRFLQLYLTRNWKLTTSILALAEKYAFDAIVITVDAQILGFREEEKKWPLDTRRVTLEVLKEATSRNYTNKEFLAERDLALNWETIARIRKQTSLKIVLKGILHSEDVKLAEEHCDAIWLSNHGGRQLSIVQSAVEVLPQIRAMTKLPLWVDGGIRTGEDIFKCLAKGADFVWFGRPLAYAMTLGEEGILQLVSIFEDELKRTMALTGCESIASIANSELMTLPCL